MTTQSPTITVHHASEAVLRAEEAAGAPRRCYWCGILCRDVQIVGYQNRNGSEKWLIECLDRETCAIRTARPVIVGNSAYGELAQ